MNDDQIRTLLLHFMNIYQRRRIILQRRLIQSHNLLLRNLIFQRRKTSRNIFAVNNDIAARFVAENTRFARFRERKKLQRCEKCWQTLQAPENEALFFQYFRMNKKTFQQLCDKLRPGLKTNATVQITIPLTVEKQLAICLYKLATGCGYKDVGVIFGVSKSTVHKYVRAVVKAIIELQNEFIKFPETAEALSMAKGFEKVTKLPNIYGVIDFTHIPILPPDQKISCFMNSKGWPSMVLQAVVDHELLFRNVFITTGNIENNLEKADIFQQIAEIFPKACIDTTTHGDLPLMLIGDTSYPLNQWLLKPFLACVNAQQKNFNGNIEAGLNFAHQAFERLKGRWQCLSQKIELDPDFMPSIILACAILHNYLELQNETYFDKWSQEFKTNMLEFAQPRIINNANLILNENIAANELRNKICDFNIEATN